MFWNLQTPSEPTPLWRAKYYTGKLSGVQRTNDRILGSGSCSALIKILPGNQDLYVAHDTWNSYQSMLRMLKKYDFAYHWTSEETHSRGHKTVPGQVLSFSGYPGVIYSGDDFTLSSAGLAITETTIGK